MKRLYFMVRKEIIKYLNFKKTKQVHLDYGKPDLGKDSKGINWKPFGSWKITK